MNNKTFKVRPFVNKKNNQATIVLPRKQFSIPKGKTFKDVTFEVKKVKWR